MEIRETEPLAEVQPRSPDLVLIAGGQALEGTVEIVPNVTDMGEAEFHDHIHSLLNGSDELGRLLEVDHTLNARTVELNIEISKMTEELHQIYAKKVWLNGPIGDRR